MTTERKQAEWHRMTRDELEGNAAALWMRVDLIVSLIDGAGTGSFLNAALGAALRQHRELLSEALK